MVIITVDSQRRIYIPQKLPFEAEKVIVIPQGNSYLLIPIPRKIIEIDVPLSTRELRKMAEEKAKKEAMERATRTKHV